MNGIQSISPANIHFRASETIEGTPSTQKPQKVIFVDDADSIEFSNRSKCRKSTTGKKWGVGVASFLCPGLGQACNGQWGKAALHFGAQIGLHYLALGTFMANPILAAAAGLGILGLRIGSIVDAVKNV